jgi:hypothetical protein
MPQLAHGVHGRQAPSGPLSGGKSQSLKKEENFRAIRSNGRGNRRHALLDLGEGKVNVKYFARCGQDSNAQSLMAKKPD